MASIPASDRSKKPHAVCFPYPAQGHINPMLKLAKLLHHRGFHITFVHTEFNYHRLFRQPATDDSSLRNLPGFRFESIPDGLPRLVPHRLVFVGESMEKNCPATFHALLSRLCDGSDPDVPPVSCIISDLLMSFTASVAEELGVPSVFLWAPSAFSLLPWLQFPQLIERGIIPLKDEIYLTNGYLDTVIDWMTGIKSIRLRDLPTIIRTTNRDDPLLTFTLREIGGVGKATAIILNTFETLEKNVLSCLSTMLPPLYPIGPLNLLLSQVQSYQNDRTSKISCSLWEEDNECLRWLDLKEPKSVIYVNFGSVTMVMPEQLVEFAWGLANSEQNFLWVIRPDLVVGESAILPPEFSAETKDRGLISNWVPQEEVLGHPSVGGFFTASGWNSNLESVCNEVPMLYWPTLADQPTNCLYCCTELMIGMEIDGNVKRREVEMMVRELMNGEKGRAMRDRVTEWKKLACEAVGPSGSSRVNFDKIIKEVLLSSESSKLPLTGQ